MILSSKLKEDLWIEDIWIDTIIDLFMKKDIGEVLKHLVHQKYSYNIHISNDGGDTYNCITLYKNSYVIRLQGEEFALKRVWKEVK